MLRSVFHEAVHKNQRLPLLVATSVRNHHSSPVMPARPAFSAVRLPDPPYTAPFHELETITNSPRYRLPPDTANLRKAIKPALLKIQTVYPDLAIGEREGGIEVLPESLPAISAR